MDSAAEDNSVREIVDLSLRYRALLATVQECGAVTGDETWTDLAETKRALEAARARQEAERTKARELEAQARAKAAIGVPLGPETTGLQVVTTIRIQPIPSGVYHLLDPEADSLLTLAVENEMSLIRSRVSAATLK